MADKKRIVGLCAALAAVVILIILLMRSCGGTRVPGPTEPSETNRANVSGETVQTETADETEATEETTEATEETTEATEETEPEETQGSSGNSTPGGYNPDFGVTDDDDDEDDDEDKEPFAAPAAGVVNNPYVEKLTAVPGEISTVMIPVEGTVYYEIHGAANSVLTLEDPDATVICGEITCKPDDKGLITLPVGDGTEPVTIQLSNAGGAEEGYLLRFVGPVGSESNPEVLESIAEIPVNLAAGDTDGYYYLWTVTQTGELTLQPQAEGYVILATIDGTTVSSADSEDGSVLLEVQKDQELTIQVIAIADEEGNYPEVTDTIAGTLADKGTIQNPYVRYLTQIPAEIATVEVPIDGYLVYDIYGAGETVMTIADPDAVVVYNTVTFTPDETGVMTIAFDILEPETAARLAISCSGEEAKALTLNFAYPEGSEKNPILLDTLDPVTVTLAGGGDNVRCLSWTAEKTGTVTVQVDSAAPGTVSCGVSLMTETDIVASETMETSVSLNVEAGQTVLIHVRTAPDAEGVYPAAEITISGTFEPKPGTAENPIALTVPESTVSVPAGESLYCTVQAPGMNLTLMGEDVSLTLDETEYSAEGGQICVSLGDAETALAVITNHGEEDAVYGIYFDYPLGSEENPALMTLGENTAHPEEGESYRFTWTAETGGQLTIAAGEETAWSYTIENLTDAGTGAVAGAEASQMVEVSAGDELRISIESDAGTLRFTASFFDPTLGTEENPIPLALPSDKITLPAGETVYYRAAVSGADMTLKGSNVSVTMGEASFTLEEDTLILRCDAVSDDAEVVFAFTNTGKEKESVKISFAYPTGSIQNPDQLILGENTARVEADGAGYYYAWTAEVSGELTISAAEGTAWTYRIENLTNKSTEAVESSNASESVTVSAGDELRIRVSADAEGDVAFAVSFLDPTLGTEENPIALNVPLDAITVPAGETRYYQVRAEGMLLTLTGDQVSICYDGTDHVPKDSHVVLSCGDSCVFAVTNTDAKKDSAYTVSFAYPEGHQKNPEKLEPGEESCAIEAGGEGYFYTWTAEDTGVLTITMEEKTGWSCRISNLTAKTEGEIVTSDGEITELTVSVTAGEELEILINTYDPDNPGKVPAGTVKFESAFRKAAR